MISVRLEQVSLTFTVRHIKRLTLKELLIGRAHGRQPPVHTVEALRDINLRIGEGERVGILGANGAGKTSLLRLIAGIYPPTSGQRTVTGRVSSLFDIAGGFEMDASGWDNIAFRGYLQGETPSGIRAKTAAIADFSELGHFLDLPVRCYSSGMLVRLAFAIVTAIEPEILLVDESLAVGDLAFQQKARQRMADMMAKARLIVVVSHDLSALQEICSQGIWLDRGQVRRIGPIREVAAEYQNHVLPAA